MPRICETVEASLDKYFDTLEGSCPKGVYHLVIEQAEKSMLKSVLRHAKGNQSKAAKWLGLSRNTLRKMLDKYSTSL